MMLLSYFAVLLGIALCDANPVTQLVPSATLNSVPGFTVNAIIPTASGQIGINPVDIPLKKDYTASIGVDTEYLTELVKDGKTSTDWVGTATNFGLVTYTTSVINNKAIETSLPRGFLVARHEDGQIEITLSKRMKDELHEVDDLVPKCDADDKDCLLKRPTQFLSLLVQRAVPVRAANVLARDIGNLTGLEIGSTIASGSLIAFGSESVVVAASEALTALMATVEVGAAIATAGVGAAVMAGFAVLWGLNNEFSGEWKLKTDAHNIDLPKEPDLKCPAFRLACVGQRCKGGKGSFCTNDWPGCPCDVSGLSKSDSFFMGKDWSTVQKALDAFIPGKVVDVNANCYAGADSKYVVDMDGGSWKDTLKNFCKTKPLLRNSFDETWTGSELDLDDYGGWSFNFKLECNEENSCDGYTCEDVFNKFIPCTEDDMAINWGELELDCGKLTYSIDSGVDKTPLEWESEPSCFAADEFGDHKPVKEDKLWYFAQWACENANNSPIKKDDSDSFIFFQHWFWGVPYQYNVWWKDSCELDNGKTELYAANPFDDGSSKVCEWTLWQAYKDCDNGGVGGSWTAGCLVYEFRLEDSGTTSTDDDVWDMASS